MICLADNVTFDKEEVREIFEINDDIWEDIVLNSEFGLHHNQKYTYPQVIKLYLYHELLKLGFSIEDVISITELKKDELLTLKGRECFLSSGLNLLIKLDDIRQLILDKVEVYYYKTRTSGTINLYEKACKEFQKNYSYEKGAFGFVHQAEAFLETIRSLVLKEGINGQP